MHETALLEQLTEDIGIAQMRSLLLWATVILLGLKRS